MNGASTGGVDPGGWAGWMISRFRGTKRPRPRLILLERITLAPRQSLALVEAEGRRLLVASSTDGSPALYPLDDQCGRSADAGRKTLPRGRTSW